jgi:hypothetical protein
MLEKIKQQWRKATAYVAALPAVLWIALKWPYMVVGLATIPVENFVSQKFNMPPTVSKFVGLGIFFLLLAVSWWSLELIVLLATVAIAADIILLVQKISDRRLASLREANGLA